MKEISYLELNYDELDSKVEQLYDIIKVNNFVPDTMLAIARGGWFVARVLSDIYNSLDIPVEIISITTKFYTNIGKTSRRPVLIQEVNQSLYDQNVLIVDDVSDTGSTLIFVKGYVKWLGARNIKVACTFMKPKTKLVPDYYVEEVSNNTWIVFPYEVRETKKLRKKNNFS